MPPEQAANPVLFQLVPIALMLAIFYFIVLRPEQKKKADHMSRVAQLQKNDRVITSGGIHGTVISVKKATFDDKATITDFKNSTVILRVDDNVKIEVDLEAITTIEAKSKS